MSDLLERLGGIAPERVLLRPAPGTATEEDVLAVHRETKRLCELVDGTLVEKGMGYRESLLALAIAEVLDAFVLSRDLGIVTGEAGMMRLSVGLVRIPDIAFVCWDRLQGRVPEEPIPHLAPDLAVEVLSRSNTQREMRRKLDEYFSAGVRLVWMVDPSARTVAVYTSPKDVTVLGESAALDGGLVLSGLSVPLRDIFARLDRRRIRE